MIVQKTTQKSSGHIYRISCHQRVISLHFLDPSEATRQVKTENFDKAEILQQHFSSGFTIEPGGKLPAFKISDKQDNQKYHHHNRNSSKGNNQTE